MTYFQVLVACSIAGLFSLGCQNSGGYNPGGQQCADNYNPIPYAEVPPAQKTVVLKPDGTMAIKPGHYRYNHADLYYVDSQYGPNKNYRLHMQDTLQSDNVTLKPTVICQRNTRMDIGQSNINFGVTGLSDLSVGPDSKPVANSMSAKSYGFTFLPHGELVMTFNTIANEKPSLPTDALSDPNSFLYVHPENPNVVEIRSSGTAKDQKGNTTGTWYLSITFVREDLKQ